MKQRIFNVSESNILRGGGRSDDTSSSHRSVLPSSH